MKSTHGTHEFGFSARVARELDGGFDTFSAGVAEKRANQPGGRDGDELLQQPGTGVVVENPCTGNQCLRLLTDRFGYSRVRVADVRNANARRAVDIRFSGIVPHCRAFTADQRKLALGIEFKRELLLDICVTH